MESAKGRKTPCAIMLVVGVLTARTTQQFEGGAPQISDGGVERCEKKMCNAYAVLQTSTSCLVCKSQRLVFKQIDEERHSISHKAIYFTCFLLSDVY